MPTHAHPLAEAFADDLRARGFYALIALRAELAESVVIRAREMIRHLDAADIRTVNQMDAEGTRIGAGLSLAVIRLEAIEERLRELSPNIYFNNRGESCVKETPEG